MRQLLHEMQGDVQKKHDTASCAKSSLCYFIMQHSLRALSEYGELQTDTGIGSLLWLSMRFMMART